MIPGSFKAIPPRVMMRQGFELMANANQSRRFSSVLTGARANLRAVGVPVIVNEHRGARPVLAAANLKRPKRRWLGQLALELYFSQLFRSDSALLDLWPSRLGVDADRDAVWSPRPLYVQWAPEFLKALRDLYAGFFLGDGARLDEGVRDLGLGSSAPRIFGHLGDGNQRSVRFSSANLRSTLREFSGHRSAKDPQLHPNFVAFGLYVSSLHSLLESLDLSFDVRSAFMRVHAAPSFPVYDLTKKN